MPSGLRAALPCSWWPGWAGQGPTGGALLLHCVSQLTRAPILAEKEMRMSRWLSLHNAAIGGPHHCNCRLTLESEAAVFLQGQTCHPEGPCGA